MNKINQSNDKRIKSTSHIHKAPTTTLIQITLLNTLIVIPINMIYVCRYYKFTFIKPFKRD